MSKDETSVPTVMMYELLITCVIDVNKERFTGTVDIQELFLQKDQPDEKEIILHLIGSMAEILETIDPKVYRNKIFDQNGREILRSKAQR